MRISLQLLNGEKIERSLEMDSFIIGRSAKCDVVVPHEGMSRQHCQIELMNGEVFVTDLGSTNGVLIDGQKIEPHKKTHYATYLTLAFGAVQSMQILITEPTNTIQLPVNLHKKDSKEVPLQLAATSTSTKTKSIPDSSKVKIQNPKKESGINVRSIIINIFCLFIVFAAAWWYTQNNNDPQETTIESPDEFVEP